MAYEHSTTDAPASAIPVLVPFQFEGKVVRAVEIDGASWFVGKDVAERLGYTNPSKAMNDHCKGVTKRYPLLTTGGMQEVRILSEPDVLRLIIGSKLPAAERFERWVFEEVLPTIRCTGRYEPEPAVPLPAKLGKAIPRDRITTLDFQGHSLRVIDRRGVPWFVVKDVCLALGALDPSSTVADLGPGEKELYSIPTSVGRTEVLVVNEIGLQIVLLRRRGVTTPGTPAYEFRRWVDERLWPRETADEAEPELHLATTNREHFLGVYAASVPGCVEIRGVVSRAAASALMVEWTRVM